MVNYNSALWNRLWTQRDIFKAEAEHEYFWTFFELASTCSSKTINIKEGGKLL